LTDGMGSVNRRRIRVDWVGSSVLAHAWMVRERGTERLPPSPSRTRKTDSTSWVGTAELPKIIPGGSRLDAKDIRRPGDKIREAGGWWAELMKMV
jgi:hypothetical protein